MQGVEGKAHPSVDRRIELVIRVGFSGHLDLGTMDASKLTELITQHLKEVRKEGASICVANSAIFRPEPRLEVITGLARGADLCAAKACLDAGGTLVAVSPFHWSEFCEDFDKPDWKGDLEIAEQLWNRESVRQIELVTELGDSKALSTSRNGFARRRGYKAQGEFILGHCDLLLVFVDRSRGEGKEGGTDWIKYKANARNIPVLAIDQDDGSTMDGAGTLQVALEDAMLVECLDVPPKPSFIARTRCWLKKVPGRVRRWFGRKAAADLESHAGSGHHHAAHETSYTEDYLSEASVDKRSYCVREVSRLYDTAVKALGGKPTSAAHRPPEATRRTVPEALLVEYDRADELAIFYNGLHRSGIMVAYLLGFLAVLMAVVGHVLDMEVKARLGPNAHGAQWASIVEMVSLVLIAVLVGTSRDRRWRAKGSDYRFLAELLRSAMHLYQLRSRPALPSMRAHGSDGGAHETWMMWFARHCIRRCDLASITFDERTIKDCVGRLQWDLVTDQADFHLKSFKRYASVEFKLKFVTYVLFSGAVYGCLSHLFHFNPWPGSGAGWTLVLTAALPTLVAALHSIANHMEFARLERRYAAMESYLRGKKTELQEMSSESRLDNREKLLKVVGDVTKKMVDEVSEWRWLHAVHDARLP